ncbi:MAG: hypothetical protein JWM91_1468, partial [Rhodospirillales bacterium]|nr:hypothetical protein [Rhodospirillales bacterium]
LVSHCFDGAPEVEHAKPVVKAF